MFTFTPLLGAQSTSNASQSILELDGGIKILIGTGWDEGFDPRQLVDLEKSAFPIVHSPTKNEGFEY
jgi:cleavage and polyadenylation specificity factor subunit 2